MALYPANALNFCLNVSSVVWVTNIINDSVHLLYLEDKLRQQRWRSLLKACFSIHCNVLQQTFNFSIIKNGKVVLDYDWNSWLILNFPFLLYCLLNYFTSVCMLRYSFEDLINSIKIAIAVRFHYSFSDSSTITLDQARNQGFRSPLSKHLLDIV